MTSHDTRERGLDGITDDPPLMEQIAETFRGRQRGMTILVWLDGFAIFILAILCAWRFFQVETPRLQIMYAVCFLFFMIGVVAVKIWYWMVIHRNQVVRRIVRLERRIEELAVQSRG
jgi:hypothetical protein